MNIFITNKCPKICAEFLDDKRVVKMVLETAQLLATSINEHGGNATYKSTHKNHPSAVWSRETKCNYLWLLRHFRYLCNEYTARFNKIHKSSQYYKEFLANAYIIPNGELTPFVNCAANESKGISFKHVSNVYRAYRDYLFNRWLSDVRKPVWFKLNKCSFLSQSDNDKLLKAHS